MTLSTTPECGIIILAAGLGKRMHSSLPKVLHELGGSPLLFHILHRVKEVAPHAPIALVVGHGYSEVEAAIKKNPSFSDLAITYIHQSEQRGTGHAARCAMDSPWGEAMVRAKKPVLILPGDLPLVSTHLITQMLENLGSSCALRLLTCELSDPTGYGRVVRRGKVGPVLRIVEEKDANLREKQLHEVGASIYLFQSAFLRAGLHRISNKNSQGEYYLTDLLAQAVRAKKRIDVLSWPEVQDIRGVNDPWELAQAGRILNERCLRMWALHGVRFVDPCSTWVDTTVELAEEVSIHPGVILTGKTRVARGAILESGAVLKNVIVGEGAHIKTGTVAEDATIESRAKVGPYANLRSESFVGASAKIGNFVELKKAKVGSNSSIAHLSYVGDAEIGKDVNIGCGFVTCNYDGRVIDGRRKHQTIIEDGVFVGSDCQTVAPVRIGKGAYVASGSTITQDVEAEALAIARSRQVNKPGYARKLRSLNSTEG